MKIRINERLIELPDGTTIAGARRLFKRTADIVVYNGFPFAGDHVLSDSDELFLITRGEIPCKEELEYLMVARHTPNIHTKLKSATVGIAGAGGLGSNIAVALARVGVGRLIIADFDVVEPSNLNRQQYFVKQIGMLKVNALKENLDQINPFIDVDVHGVRITDENIAKIFGKCQIVVEAFDKAEMKTMLINTVIEKMPQATIVAASGLAGYGPGNEITTRRLSDRLYVTGDLVSEAMPGSGLMSPRVMIAAGHQANQVLRLILGETGDFE